MATAKVLAQQGRHQVQNGPVDLNRESTGGVPNEFLFARQWSLRNVPTSLPQLNRISIDSAGHLTANSPSLRPQRFLGWNYGRTRGGPAYFQHFSRLYGGVPPPVARVAATSATKGTALASSSAASLDVPASLPGFAFHPTLPAGYLPTSVATGDFNKDGKMDWVVSNGGGNTIWLYLGNGDGTVQLPIIIPLIGAAPVQVVAADLRQTGVLDLVVAEADSQTVGVLLGNGDGTFAPEVTYVVPRPPLSVAVGDFNGDGHPDIAVGLLGDELSGPLATLPGDGTGKFGAPIVSLFDDPTVGSFASIQIATGNLNSDNLPDLVVVDAGEVVDGAHSYLSRGDGTFKHIEMFNGAAAVALGDMDGDGCLDAVAVAPGFVTINRGSCDGSFSKFPGYLRGGADELVSVALADINADGHLDVVAGGANVGAGGQGQDATNLVVVLLGDGHGALGLAHVYRSEPSMYGLAAADLNGDGHPDVIVASQDTDTTSAFINDGTGGFSAPNGEYIGYLDGTHFGASNAPFTDFFVRDIDGDGKPDLALVEGPEFSGDPWMLAVMLNDGTGHFGPAIRSPIVDFSHFPFGYALADFRNTGVPDLLTYEFDPIHGTGPALSFAPNTGLGTFGAPLVSQLNDGVFSEFGILASGDFNHDGKLDFVLACPKPSATGTMQVTTFFGNGNGTFQQGATQVFATGLTLGSSPRSIFAGDFNRDGKLDLLIWTNDSIIGTLNHNVYELLGNGDGTFQPARLIFPNFGFFAVADFNHDGLPDIVEYVEPLNTTAELVPYGFNIYLGQPDGSFQLSNTYQPYTGLFNNYVFDNGSPQQTASPMVADFNGDGNLDIAAFQSQASFPGTSYLQILLGNGDGTFTPSYAIIPLDKQSVPTTAADVTGDGRADLIESDGLVSSFHVIPSVPGPALQLSLPVKPIIGSKGTLVVSQTLVSDTASKISLSASDPNITIQATVTIPAGSLSISVPFTIGPGFDASRVFTLTAQLGTQTAVIYSHQATTASSGFQIVFAAGNQPVVPPSGNVGFGIGLLSYGGYTTTVQLSCQGLPPGTACQFNPTSVAIQPNPFGFGSTVTVQADASVPLGTYTFQVVGNDAAITAVLPMRLVVADFSVAFTPASVTVVSGQQAKFNATIGTLGQWTGPVNSTCQVTPPKLIGCPFGSPITFPGSYPVTVFTNQAPPGDYTFLVSASADGVTHNASPAVLHVQGISGMISSNSATISVGGSANFNAALSSQNGLTDQFTFSCPGLPGGLSCSFNPPSGTLPADGTLSTVLTISVTSRPASVLSLQRWNVGTPPLTAIVVVLSLVLFYAGMRSGKKHRIPAMVCSTSVVLIVSLAGCGGGGGNTGPPPPTPTPTPQTKTVVVTVHASSASINTDLGFITVTIP